MSDGPHRSLKMHRSWKRLAEYADNGVYSIDEVANAFVPALDQSCREEVPDSVWREIARVFKEPQRTLFTEQRIDQLSALRTQVSGRPLGCALIDAAVQSASNGAHGEDALIDVTTRALEQRGARGNKQVEEHWYRKSSERRTEKLRSRLETALNKAALGNLARQHLNIGSVPKVSRSTKQTGLDDGVQF